MGGTGSGRKSVKFEAIKTLMDVQLLLQEMKHIWLESNMTRSEIEEKVEEKIKWIKVRQEEIERVKA